MKLSIIIPVYNAERFLKKCIISVLNQDFNDFELLLINDGSTDNSIDICRHYATECSRIKVFDQPNSGVSAARNLGLRNARGEWITFIDSDDYVSENYFSGFLKHESEKLDWIFLSINRVTPEGNFGHFHFEEFRLERTQFMRKFTLYPHFPGPYAKFYKAAHIRNHQIEFDKNLNFGEDALFNLQYLFTCSNIAGINEGIYYYRSVENGLSTRITTTSEDHYLYDKILQLLKHKNTDEIIISSYIKFPLERLFFTTLESKVNFKNKRAIFKTIITDFRKELIEFTNSKTPYLYLLSLLIKFRQLNLLIVSSNFRNLIKA